MNERRDRRSDERSQGKGHANRAAGGVDRGQGTNHSGAPPEQTGAETNYIVKNMEARTPMVVRLTDNEEVRGWIEYYDEKMIKLNRRQPPHLFIRKDNIKYMYKDEQEPAPFHRDKP